MTESPHEPDGLWLLDLDGVVWLRRPCGPRCRRGDPPAGGPAGRRVAFFTNNSFSSRVELLKKFADHDIDATTEDVLSSAEAAAGLLEPGERAFVLGGPAIVEALGHRGVNDIENPGPKDVDVVVVEDFDQAICTLHD